MTSINFVHDPLCPPYRVRNRSHGSRNPCSAVVLRKFACCEYARGDEQYTLATLIHASYRLAYSLFIRHSSTLGTHKCQIRAKAKD